jgi:hypothetical protein
MGRWRNRLMKAYIEVDDDDDDDDNDELWVRDNL